MGKQQNVTFDLAGLPQFKPEPGAAEPPVFGPEFGGTFVIRVPTYGDVVTIDALSATAWGMRGLSDPGAAPVSTHAFVKGLVYVDQLAVSKPEWWPTMDSDADPDVSWAVIRARQVAEDLLLDAKKKRAADGVKS